MTEIPEDIRRAAKAVTGELDWECWEDCIARAILAERQKNAQIAERLGAPDVAKEIRG